LNYDGGSTTGSSTVTVPALPAGDTTPVASTSPPSAYSQITAISGLNFPMSVAVDNYGNVHVADPGDDVVKKFNSSLELLFTISGLSNPFDVGVDNSGNIYVLDQGTSSVKKYDSSGSFITQSSIPGTAQSLSVVKNKVYVTSASSAGNSSFRVLDSSLNNLLTVPGTNGHNYYPQAITADSSGNIYVFNAFDGPNTYAGDIKKYSSSGQITNVFGGYTSSGELGKFSHQVFGIEVDSSGNIYAAEHNNKTIQVLDSSGNLVRWFGDVGSGLGQFGRLNDVTVDSAGNIYTAEPWENSRIQIFPPNYGQAPSSDTTFPAETPAIIFGSKQYNLDSSQYQLAHEFTGNTPKIWIGFNDWVPTTGSNTNIVAVFPNAQPNLPLHCGGIGSFTQGQNGCLNIPYTLIGPGGTETGVLNSLNTTDHYDMVLSTQSEKRSALQPWE
jgi:sugar lactone lactonase YvrE